MLTFIDDSTNDEEAVPTWDDLDREDDSASDTPPDDLLFVREWATDDGERVRVEAGELDRLMMRVDRQAAHAHRRVWWPGVRIVTGEKTPLLQWWTEPGTEENELRRVAVALRRGLPDADTIVNTDELAEQVECLVEEFGVLSGRFDPWGDDDHE